MPSGISKEISICWVVWLHRKTYCHWFYIEMHSNRHARQNLINLNVFELAAFFGFLRLFAHVIASKDALPAPTICRADVRQHKDLCKTSYIVKYRRQSSHISSENAHIKCSYLTINIWFITAYCIAPCNNIVVIVGFQMAICAIAQKNKILPDDFWINS